jgi:hypothetical protein
MEIAMTRMNGALMVLGLCAIVGGCAPTTLGENWGTAYQTMKANQVSNPAAGEQLDPVVGQDGRVAATAMEAYRKGFEKPDAGLDRSLVTTGVQTK